MHSAAGGLVLFPRRLAKSPPQISLCGVSCLLFVFLSFFFRFVHFFHLVVVYSSPSYVWARPLVPVSWRVSSLYLKYNCTAEPSLYVACDSRYSLPVCWITIHINIVLVLLLLLLCLYSAACSVARSAPRSVLSSMRWLSGNALVARSRLLLLCPSLCAYRPPEVIMTHGCTSYAWPCTISHVTSLTTHTHELLRDSRKACELGYIALLLLDSFTQRCTTVHCSIAYRRSYSFIIAISYDSMPCPRCFFFFLQYDRPDNCCQQVPFGLC